MVLSFRTFWFSSILVAMSLVIILVQQLNSSILINRMTRMIHHTKANYFSKLLQKLVVFVRGDNRTYMLVYTQGLFFCYMQDRIDQLDKA